MTVGSEDKDYVQITGAIQPGDKVVILSASPVKDGQTVRVDTSRNTNRRVFRCSGIRPDLNT